MPPKKLQNEPNPTFTSSEAEGLNAAAQVCRYAADDGERDELLDMLGLGPIGELRIRLMRREADRVSEQAQAAPVFNHYPMRRL